jgi:NADH dehydrogenase [ubiquinone] 1 alpha subcomplex assembly factor 7
MQHIADRIRRNGPITFAEYQELALYGTDGFFTNGGGAGRAGRDFVTSPEVGPLFGALVARHLDEAWARLGHPDPFFVVEGGAGRGRLASDVLRAEPECAPALRYVLVERSAALRATQRDLLTLEPADEVFGPVVTRGSGGDPDESPQPVAGMGPLVTSLAELPAVTVVGVVIANELLDNLPARIVERSADSWSEVRVALADDVRLEEVVVTAPPDLAAVADELAAGTVVPEGVRVPVAEGMAAWLLAVARLLHRGELLLDDYIVPTSELVTRGQDGWLRTYREHERGTSPLDAPGTQDITCDVPHEQLLLAARRAGFSITADLTQAAWLAALGIDELVAEGASVWRARAHLGDLEAVAGRSRASEAAALTDAGGLGAHRVMLLERAVG